MSESWNNKGYLDDPSNTNDLIDIDQIAMKSQWQNGVFCAAPEGSPNGLTYRRSESHDNNGVLNYIFVVGVDAVGAVQYAKESTRRIGSNDFKEKVTVYAMYAHRKDKK